VRSDWLSHLRENDNFKVILFVPPPRLRYTALYLYIYTCSNYIIYVSTGFLVMRDWNGYKEKKTLETEISHFRCGSQITIVADHTKYWRIAMQFFSARMYLIYIYHIVDHHRVCHDVRECASSLFPMCYVVRPSFFDVCNRYNWLLEWLLF